jgi:hypothetical protein
MSPAIPDGMHHPAAPLVLHSVARGLAYGLHITMVPVRVAQALGIDDGAWLLWQRAGEGVASVSVTTDEVVGEMGGEELVDRSPGSTAPATGRACALDVGLLVVEIPAPFVFTLALEDTARLQWTVTANGGAEVRVAAEDRERVAALGRAADAAALAAIVGLLGAVPDVRGPGDDDEPV